MRVEPLGCSAQGDRASPGGRRVGTAFSGVELLDDVAAIWTWPRAPGAETVDFNRAGGRFRCGAEQLARAPIGAV